MKEQTPLMKLLQMANDHEAMINRLGENNYNLGALSAVSHFKEWITKLLPEERKSIEDAFLAGKENYVGEPDGEIYQCPQDYFTDKYGQ